jgi:hypothetical protein
MATLGRERPSESCLKAVKKKSGRAEPIRIRKKMLATSVIDWV